MQWLSPVLLAIQVVSSLSIILLVLLQQGKGADMGSSFGGGSAGSLFGATGAANFLSRATKWAAIVFFISTGGLAYMAHHPSGKSILDAGGVMQGFQAPAPANGSAVPTAPGAAVPSVPAVPSAPAPTPAKPQAPAAAVPSAPADSSSTAPAANAGQAGKPAPVAPAENK